MTVHNGQAGASPVPFSASEAASEAVHPLPSGAAPTTGAVSNGSSPALPGLPSLPLPWEQTTNAAATELPNDGTGGLTHHTASPASPASLVRPVLPRQRVRHSFDIFSDQILALRDIALKREQRSGLHARLGDLVQEALDTFIAHEAETRAETRQTPQTKLAEPAEQAELNERGEQRDSMVAEERLTGLTAVQAK